MQCVVCISHDTAADTAFSPASTPCASSCLCWFQGYVELGLLKSEYSMLQSEYSIRRLQTVQTSTLGYEEWNHMHVGGLAKIALLF
jgi:hypothetical protein